MISKFTGLKTLALTAAILATGLFSGAPSAVAGPGSCAANSHMALASQAVAISFSAALHSGCTNGIPSGAVTGCYRQTNSATMYNDFLAVWPSTAARTMDLSGGCSFMCTSGDCRVANDGLPVELLQFGVE